MTGRPLRVLVACERSGRVRDAFITRGHWAVSCDIEPSDTAGPHWRGDVRQFLVPDVWDLVVAFPPCDHLSKAGARWWPAKQADGRQQAAVDLFMALYNAPAPRVAVENPAGWMCTNFRQPDQRIEPYMFGDPWRKHTCLWLRGLPPLVPTDIVEPNPMSWIGGDARKSGAHRDVRMRSLTFQGIANAMADQWGGSVDND